MATEDLKTTGITGFDASPPTRVNAGEGASGTLRHVDAVITGTTAVTSGSTYRMVRVWSGAKVKSVKAALQASVTNFAADIGVYYSSGADVDPDLRGDVIDADFFASDVDFDSVVTMTEYIRESGVCTMADILLPLWEAVGLSADPKCWLDIVLTATETTDGAPVIYLAVEYVD